jgi:hypothetical protein
LGKINLAKKSEANNKFLSVLIRVFGYFLLFIAIALLIIATINFYSIEKLISDVFNVLIVLLPVAIIMLAHYYTFDGDSLTWHCCFLKKDIPINSIVEVRYYFFGLLSLSVYRESLSTKGDIFIILFCSKKHCIKKMKYFFEVLAKKNMSCAIRNLSP